MAERKTPASKHRVQRESKEAVGLLALGTSGPWEVAIDETLAGPARCFAQIEGPSVSLYFPLPTVEVISETLDFLSVRSRDSLANAPDTNGITLSAAKRTDIQISLRRDDESDDRYFLVIEAKSGLRLQITVADDDLDHIVNALRDAKDDLDDDD